MKNAKNRLRKKRTTRQDQSGTTVILLLTALLLDTKISRTARAKMKRSSKNLYATIIIDYLKKLSHHP